MKLHVQTKNANSLIILVLGFLFIGIGGFCNYIIGYQKIFPLFYIIPIVFMTWFVGRQIGIFASFISVLVWCWVDNISEYLYSHLFISIFNYIFTLLIYLIIVIFLSSLKNAFNHEKELARIDNLTGAMNSRLFFELLKIEMERLRRYNRPFTLAYFDLDNFKKINDLFGHPIGDEVLKRIVNYSKNNLRKADMIARFGGDEFALLLPETNHESAQIVLTRFQNGLVKELQQRNYPITLSVGVITCTSTKYSADELIKLADDLMLKIKQDGKNSIKYSYTNI